MTTTIASQIRAGTVEEIKTRGCTVGTGGGHAIAVFHHDGELFAVDNRCPHMGFPLDRGSVKDGILTCHWHHARFDLASGGTFNPFADDVRSYPVNVADGVVWVDPQPAPRDEVAHWSARLRDGMQHNIRLVIAKAVLGLQAAGCDYRVALGIGARFGTEYSADGWGAAMSMLTCMANILPELNEDDRPRALYQGLMHVARECAGKAPRFIVDPLPGGETRPEVFKSWFRNFIEVRDDDGAERCLHTAIELGFLLQHCRHGVRRRDRPHLLGRRAYGGLCQQGLRVAGPHRLGPRGTGAHQLDARHGPGPAQPGIKLLAYSHRPGIHGLEGQGGTAGLWEQGRANEGEWQDEEGLAAVMLGDDPAAIIEGIKAAVTGRSHG